MRTIYHSWLLDELCARFGDGAIDHVVKMRGGRGLFVPLTPTEHFRETVGSDVADWLCAERGGTTIEIPSPTAVKTRRDVAAKHHQIQASDLPIPTLAQKFGLSTRQVRTIKSKRRDPRIS